jgi:hypothetical protein
LRLVFSLAVIFAAQTLPAVADQNPDYVPGPWHYKAMSCVDTTVTSVTPRLGEAGQTKFTAADFKGSGVDVTFATGLGVAPLFPGSHASVVHYQGDSGNDTMAAERAGDRVQVCFLGGPAPTTYCDPDKDARGRQYRVWDYRQHKQYWGMDGEHDCGGA